MKKIEEVVSTSEKVMRFFKLERAPENIPSVSILLGSLYRNIGLSSEGEKSTNEKAGKLYKSITANDSVGNLFTSTQLASLFSSSLAVPTSTGQDKKEKFFLSPFVPAMSSYGLAARNTGNPWNPGAFIIEIIANYSPSENGFIETIRNLFSCLDINKNEDIWAHIVAEEFKSINKLLGVESKVEFDEDKFIKMYRDGKIRKNIICESSYANNVFNDLNSIIKLKGSLTRQKWIGIFEAFLRLTLFNHIIYTMNLSRSYLNFILDKLDKKEKVTIGDVKSYLDQYDSKKHILMDVNTKRTQYININVRKYCFYNTILNGVITNYIGDDFEDFKDSNHFVDFSNQLLENIKNEKTDLNSFIVEFKTKNEQMLDSISSVNPRTLKNSKECLEYLCQKKVTSKSDSSQDVNYIFERESHKGFAPYKFDLSAGILSTLCCLIFSKIESDQNFMSGIEFIKHLEIYNINLNIKDISIGKIKNTMQSLGIIIDSPDTEGGVLIIRPGWL